MPDHKSHHHRFSLRSFFGSKKDRRPTSISSTTEDYLYERIPNHHFLSDSKLTPQASVTSIPEPTSPTTQPTTTTTAFLWQDIDSPDQTTNYLLSVDDDDDDTLPSYITTTHLTSTTAPDTDTDTDPEKIPAMLTTTTKQPLHSHPNTPITSLPGYNDVSGAVIVDWDGLPHFLSPQEEEDRKMKLQRAVKEKMLGLPRCTDFEWERSEAQEQVQSQVQGVAQGMGMGMGMGRSVSLPKYSPTKGKGMGEGMAMGRVVGRSSVR
ncbi:hypothetical protein BO78DRAFT_472291 [Aspergillus sclerotiicarbonarius CBS 121057]|uniref:Uncharacterized protein n=1 Tax=Aspergillus sclerotiicarbonarius (strain CBS 121057 / IBT 28362) TaxID=1448318 RepID=A0A319DYL3_ASPSB|nr:hypothetical protein BO78DRAFT_472291 [Aspergillus sclerotiicarbonarius CBS 121057]